LSPFGIVIYINLSINAEEAIRWIGSKRIDFNLAGICADKEFPEISDLLLSVFFNGSKFELLDNIIELLFTESSVIIEDIFMDSIWMFFSYFLYFHSTLVGYNKDWSLSIAVK
jgi:hypothetical protein